MALHGRRGGTEDVGGLLDGEPAEVAQLDDARLFWIEEGQTRERFVEREDVDAGRRVAARRSCRRA